MKTAAVLAFFLGAVALAVGTVQQAVAQGGEKRITVQAKLVDVRQHELHRADTLLLFSNDRRLPIGHAVLDCNFVGRNGVLGKGVWSCRSTYVLPLGKLTAAGLIHNFRRFTLIITGGSGSYQASTGTLFSHRFVPGYERLIFRYR